MIIFHACGILIQSTCLLYISFFVISFSSFILLNHVPLFIVSCYFPTYYNRDILSFWFAGKHRKTQKTPYLTKESTIFRCVLQLQIFYLLLEPYILTLACVQPCMLLHTLAPPTRIQDIFNFTLKCFCTYEDINA